MNGAIARLDRRGATCILFYDPGADGLMRGHHAKALLDALKAAIEDTETKTIILTGAQPGVFVRHYSVGSLLRTAAAVRDGRAQVEDFDRTLLVEFYDLCDNAPKPIIAAINGVCMGGGFELALCCDYRVAQSDVTEIGLPETRIGLFPGAGGTQRLPHLIGGPRALSFILDGAVVDAAEAATLGLVDVVAPNALERALQIAARWSRHSPMLLENVLALVRLSSNGPTAEGLQRERLAFARLLRDDDAAIERMERFLREEKNLGDYLSPSLTAGDSEN